MEPSNLKNRYGRFKVSASLIDDQSEILLKLFAKVVVVRCEHDYATKTFEYLALSPMFEVVEEHSLPHEYHITFERRQADLVVTAEKINS